MDIASIFYILGIIFILSWLVLVLGIIVLGFFAYKKIRSLQSEAIEKAASISRMSKTEVMGVAGSIIASFVLNKLREKFETKENKVE